MQLLDLLNERISDAPGFGSTELLPPKNPLVFCCFRLAGSFRFLCILHHLCHRGLHGRQALNKSRVIHRSSGNGRVIERHRGW